MILFGLANSDDVVVIVVEEEVEEAKLLSLAPLAGECKRRSSSSSNSAFVVPRLHLRQRRCDAAAIAVTMVFTVFLPREFII